MVKIKQALSFIFSRCLWFYLLAAFILFYYAQKKTPINVSVSTLYGLKAAESGMATALHEKQPIPKEECYRAIRYYKKLEAFIGPRSYIFGNMGFCYYHLKNYDKALEAYDKAIALSPFIYTYYADKAAIYLDLGKYPEAVFWLRQSLGRVEESILHYQNFFQYLMTTNGISLEKEAGELYQEVQKDLLILNETLLRLSFFMQQKDSARNSRQTALNNAGSSGKVTFKNEGLLLHFDTFLARLFTDFEVLDKVKNDSRK